MNDDLIKIIDCLLRLNDTGLHTAVFLNGSSTKYFDFWVYPNREGVKGDDVFHMTIDYERSTLRDPLTQRIITPESIEDYLILLVQ